MRLVDLLGPLTDCPPDRLGVVVVDHGSRRGESNELLEGVVRMFRDAAGLANVEPAHMELAEPSIDQAFAECVANGATTVVIFPYFLAPGRHWTEDIPRLASSASKRHPGVRYLVTAPLGLHALIADVMAERILACLGAQLADGRPCEMCGDAPRCKLREEGDSTRYA